MGKSIIIPGANFSLCGIPSDNPLVITRSAKKVRALKVPGSEASYFGGLTSPLFEDRYNNYAGYTYLVDVRWHVGENIRITFCVGYASTILANGGFVSALPSSVDFSNSGWKPSDYVELTYISTVADITSEQSNVWVTKTYTIPANAKYLLFTSKDLSGGTASAELVEEAES